jgi:hypothetical protein
MASKWIETMLQQPKSFQISVSVPYVVTLSHENC